MKRALFPCLLSVAIGMVAPTALAQSDPADRDARALFDEGVALANRAKADGDMTKYEAARRKFSASYALGGQANVLFDLAMAESKLARSAEALHHFRQFVRDAHADPKLRQRAMTAMDKLSTAVATVHVAATDGAEIFIDGVSTGETAPLADPIDLLPGTHTIAAKLGDRGVTKSVDVASGEASLQIDLPVPVVAAALAPIVPRPTSNGVAPAAPTELPYSVGRSDGSARTIALYSLAGVGVAALGLGIGFLVAASDSENQVRFDQGSFSSFRCSGLSTGGCLALNNAAQSHATESNIGVGSLVVAGAAAAGLVGTLLFWHSSGTDSPRASTASIRITPSIGPAMGAVMVSGEL